LEEFRNAWKQEVQKKHIAEKPQDKGEGSSNSTVEHTVDDIVEKTESLTTNDTPVTAMDHYVIAVDNERQGKLGKALDSYRRAFKLDPDIDYAYKKHYQDTILPSIQKDKDKPTKDEGFKHIVPLGKEYTAPSATRLDPLAELISSFANDPELSYIPQLDYKPVSVAKLPNEVMLHIVRHLILNSISTLPYFALTCKKFFLYSRDPSVWQYACFRVFKTPGMTLEQSRQYQCNQVLQYDGHWMRMFIDRPRIRYDGVYISTCHYIRPGASDTAWNKPIHFVTYYRYIRFFPDGTVLKHLTTDEPIHVVKWLVPGFHKKQCFHGKFLLENNDHIMIVMKDPSLKGETFNLSLKIKTTHRGRHNKLVWDEYTSTSSIPGRMDHQYDLKLFKSFFFSPCLLGKYIQKKEASVLSVDFSQKTYTINFVMQANGTLANEIGQLNQRITLRFSAIKSYDLETGDVLNPIQVTFKYDEGSEIDYPLDFYSGVFDLFAYYMNDTSQSIPITFHLDASITSFHFMPTLEHHQQYQNGTVLSDRISLKILTGRSTTTQGFSIFICILMWLLSLLMGLFGFQVVFRKRRADAHACMIGITTLFALPAVRSAQPGIPDVGCVSDILGYYWNMAIIACSSIAVIMCWVIRWEKPEPMLQRSVHPDAFSEHVNATVRLTKVALELEWTIFTRFTVGVLTATILSTFYLVLTLRNSKRPLVVWEKLNKPLIKLFRPKIFSLLLGNVNPYSASIDMRISTFSRGFCTGFMRDRHRNRNPFKSIHATALATFAESVGELCLLSNLQPKDEISLMSLELEFVKKARGLLTASTDFTFEEGEEPTQEVKLQVVVKDRTLDTVAIAHLVWSVEQKSN
ncbi:uncharacterized protein EV154DRAFT_584922, partial [Mucor mucedo]|uniref:uncharacterized protein n=1 Tax=Mucor mucedo TaxID=29922 RepID=UPI002220B347